MMVRAPRRAQRGFALIIVAVCGVAMTAIALALVFTAGSQRILSVKGAAIDHATTIADSGMERGVAYLEAVARQEVDFDAVLDPGLGTDCLATVDSRATGTPRYNDGALETDADGTRYQRVDFNEGAYFTRVDDDADDAVNPTANLSTYTGNNPRAGRCLEGTGFVAGNNPHRDRNRAVWLTVVGVYPKQPLASAKNRITLRRLYTSPEPTPTAVMMVTRKAEIHSGATLKFCSDRGNMAFGDDLDIDGQLEHCGSGAANGNITGTGSNAACGAVGCRPRGGLAPGAGVVLPPFPSAASKPWVDSASPCNFLIVDKPKKERGLYYWDGEGPPRKSGRCALFDPLVTPPMGAASDFSASNPGAFIDTSGKSCWMPLLLVDDPGDSVQAGVESPCGVDGWCPRAGDTSVARGNVGSPFLATGNAWDGREFTDVISKPDFGLCQGVSVQFRPGGAAESCVGDCDGTQAVLRFNGPAWQFQNTFAAYPVGVYATNDNDYTFNMAAPTIPADDATPGAWPLMTFFAPDKMKVDSDVVIGVGSSAPPTNNPTGGTLRWPSLLVGGDLEVRNNSKLVLGGSLFMNGKATLRNNSQTVVYGQIAIGDELKVENSAVLEVRHDDDFTQASQEQIITSASTSKTIR